MFYFYSDSNAIVAGNSNNDVGESGLSQLQEFNEDVGNGKCSFERAAELAEQGQICSQEATSQMRSTTRGVSLCPIIDEIVECIDPFSECYSPEEMARFQGINLKVAIALFESIAEQSGSSQFASVIGLLKSCSSYKQFVRN